MARPLRIEYAGALYHVTSRGNRRKSIYLNDDDRMAWLDGLAQTCNRFNWVVHAYCQMTNHYHLLVETVDGNLSRGMRQLNGAYSQRFNRRHDLSGHLFQGRFHAILVQKEGYLLELGRYVVLNPLRARMVERPEDWRWSSYPAVMGSVGAPPWLDADWILGQFARQRSKARELWKRFVMEGLGAPDPLGEVRHQLILGDDDFTERFRHEIRGDELREYSKAQKRSLALTLKEYKDRFKTRNEAMAKAYLSGAYTMREIAEYFGMHYMTVSRAVRRFETDRER